MEREDFPRIDQAFGTKAPSDHVCPICRTGQFETLRSGFAARPTAGGEAIDAAGRVCVHCGFLALHATNYLLDEGH